MRCGMLRATNKLRIKIWDANTGTFITNLKKHKWTVYYLAWTKDGTTLISEAGDSAVCLHLDGHPFAALSTYRSQFTRLSESIKPKERHPIVVDVPFAQGNRRNAWAGGVRFKREK
ncbi:hypothetical protein K503DRAFT_145091 [Rhizopogon vinicolor AM-OR11-026]|uniref:Uncharacterized protein n=1 Tax=Rhizopogon vinicolor AM-OR11-026 TaxID=1314800 RepID=A0A1B7N1E1_9AGAM|nr:hypothetical protein K503DRAFT_145091 [Rhizopogon vinicolor AM-OR11-026]